MNEARIESATERAGEMGYLPPDLPPRGDGLPPNAARLVIPHFTSFASVVNWATRTYRYTADEAMRHSHTNALAVRRDPIVMDAVRSRQIPVVQLPWHLQPLDDTDNRQVELAKNLTQIVEDIPHFQTWKMHLSEAVFFGRYAVQNIFRWDYSTGKRRMIVADYRPINGDKLVFRFSGQPGVLVHSALFEGDVNLTDRGRAHFFTQEERECVVIHKHEPEDSDFWEGDLGGAVHGVGLRSRIYWFWWLRAQVLGFLMDYLERVGAGGFTIYYFEAGNPESMREVKEAAETQWRNNAILFPRYRQGETGGPGIQRIDPSPAGAQLLQSLVVEYFDNVIRRYILGQSLTSEAIGTGLGSGVADLHADTFNRIVKFDAINLAETITKDLIKVLAKYNSPGVPAPKFVFDVDKPNARPILDSAQTFFEMGGQLDEDELRGIIGLAKPQPGHAVLAKMQGQSPAGMGALPQGVPMEGQPGPVPESAGQPEGPLDPTAGVGETPFLFSASHTDGPLRYAKVPSGRPGESKQETSGASSSPEKSAPPPDNTPPKPSKRKKKGEVEGPKVEVPEVDPEKFHSPAMDRAVKEVTELYEQLHDPKLTTQERIALLSRWNNSDPAVVEANRVYNPSEKRKTVKLEKMAEMMDRVVDSRLARSGFKEELEALAKDDPQKELGMRMAYMYRTSVDINREWLLREGPRAGQEWYHEDVSLGEDAIASVFAHHPELEDFRDMFGPVDQSGQFKPQTPEQQAHMVFFHLLSSVFSNGTNPEQEFVAATKTLVHAAKITKQKAGNRPINFEDVWRNLPRYQPGVKRAKATKNYPAGSETVAWTRRGNNYYGPKMELIERLIKRKGGLVPAAKWIMEKHPKAEVREVTGYEKLPGPRNWPYHGASGFGPKIGNYFANRMGEDSLLTMDLWWSRDWYGRLGSFIKATNPKLELNDTPQSDADRELMVKVATKVGQSLRLSTMEYQAVAWTRFQHLLKVVGSGKGPKSHRDGAEHVLKLYGIEHHVPGFGKSGETAPRRRKISDAFGRIQGNPAGPDQVGDGASGGGKSPSVPEDVPGVSQEARPVNPYRERDRAGNKLMQRIQKAIKRISNASQ